MKTAGMFSWARLTLTLLIALVCTSVAWAADPVSYIDENGETQTITEYTVVDQYTQFNSDRWYVVNSHVTRHDVLKTENNARIILADGASLKIGTEPAPISSASGSGLDVSGDLTIYGQEAQTGKLEVYYEGGGMWAIQVYLDMTINGGSVFVQAKMSSPYAFVVQMDKLTVNRGSLSVVAEGEGTYCYAVAATGDVSINGGSLTATASGINGLGVLGKNIYFNGGNVSATFNGTGAMVYGVAASNGIILGYTDKSDRFSASSYHVDYGYVTTKDGQAFKDEDGNAIAGPIYDERMTVFAGKTLRPCDAIGFATGSKDASVIPAQEIEIGQIPTKPEDPVRADFNFLGWYTDESFTTPFDFTAPLTQSTVAYAKWSASYIDGKGDKRVADNITKLTGEETVLHSGWYLLDNNISYSNSLKISGDVNIILADGYTLTAKCYANYNGKCDNSPIFGSDGNLTIYGQSKQTGKIVTSTSGYNHTFDVPNVTVNGGIITANATSASAAYGINAQNLTVNRGSITASGAAGYGINAENLTINGGVVTIPENSAGINATSIVINDGSVSVTAIGAYGIKSESVSVNGGNVSATASGNTTFGRYGIYVSGGDITLGYSKDSDYITAYNYYVKNGSVKIKDGQFLKDEDGNVYSGTLSDEQIDAIAGKTLIPEIPPVKYVDENGNEQSIDNYTVLTGEETQLTEGWYLAGGNIEYLNTVKMSGNVNIILADGSSMNIGSTENNLYGNGLDGSGTSNLTIYGQEKQTGVLGILAVGSNDTAVFVENLTVNGGSIYSYAASGVSGIYAKKDITINNGFVLAQAHKWGVFSEEGNLIVNGGTLDVTASEAVNGAYINKDVIVNGGTVIASGQKKGIRSKEGSLIVNGGSFTVSSGIEAFNEVVINSDVTVKGKISSSGKITINSGVVDVTGGISSSGDLTINSGVVTVVVEGSDGYGISSFKDIKVNGGSITITANSYGMFAGDSLIINNGSLAASVTSDYGLHGPYVSINGGVVTTTGISALFVIAVNGGIVTATGDKGFESLLDGPIVLGYFDDADHITANVYFCRYLGKAVVKIKDGQMFTDGEGNLYSGTLSDEQINAIAGKTLIPIKLPVAVLVDGEGRKRANIDGAYKGSDIVDIPEDIDVDTVDVARSFTTGVYSTFVFPFDVNTSNIEGLQKVLRFNGLKQRDDKSWVVRMKRLWTDTSSTHVDLSANTPYLILMKDQNLVVHGGVTLRKTVEPVATIDDCDWEFRGTLAYKKWEEGDPELGRVYGFAGQAKDGIKIGQFVKAAAGAYIYPFRAYLIKNAPASAVKSNYAGAKSMTSMSLPSEIDIVVDEDENGEQTTTIGRFNTRTGEFKMLPEYDLKGRKLNGRPKARGAYYGNKVIKK